MTATLRLTMSLGKPVNRKVTALSSANIRVPLCLIVTDTVPIVRTESKNGPVQYDGAYQKRRQ